MVVSGLMEFSLRSAAGATGFDFHTDIGAITSQLFYFKVGTSKLTGISGPNGIGELAPCSIEIMECVGKLI